MAFFVIGVVQLWHVSLSLFAGKKFSYLSALPAFFLMHRDYICLILTGFLVWLYFRQRRPHTVVFLLGVLAGLSPLLRISWWYWTEWRKI